MRCRVALAVTLLAAPAACLASLAAAADGQARESSAQLVSRAERAGLRVLTSDHFTLITDRPARDGDGVEDAPRLLDEAFVAWCRHFGLEPAAHAGWRAIGCLVVERERFLAAGLLPKEVPEFKHGFCAADRFWMNDQSNPVYRRHLLLHEAAHAFTLTLLALDTPPWYTEGIAEFLATHRIDVTDGRPRFIAAPIPRAAADVEQLGRIESLRAAREAGTAPSLRQVFATPAALHHEISAYATSWAAVTCLALHPRHAARFRAAERSGLDPNFTARLIASRGWNDDEAGRDFDAFTDEIDYGYDFARSAIDWSPGRPLAGRGAADVAAGRGWQNSGHAVARGTRCAMRAEGNVILGEVGKTTVTSTPDGISLEWYRGRPVGRLLAAQWVESDDGGRPRFVVLAEGAAGEIVARTDGPLYFKINEAPGSLADSDDSFMVTITSTE